MSDTTEVRVARMNDTSPLAQGARWLVLRLSTDNPFYVLSALLVLVGLWTSFGSQARAEQTWALVLGLAGYTLLLALPACLLVRFGGVWEDVRTVLLVVVLMFLATSVTFDEALGRDPVRGLACSLGGLVFAVVLSETVLRVTRLRLPSGLKVPYLLALCLFFGYPAALVPVLDRPYGPELQWGLYGFAATAGLIALTLIPAARKGPEYVKENGSPWPWPFYPWALFAFLGFGVVARSFLLCWSMQHVGRQGAGEVFIFGPYFLAPFALAVGAVLLAMKDGAARTAGLLAPVVAVILSAIGHRDDALYQGFLGDFIEAFGATPLYVALVAAAVYYLAAGLARVPGASAGVTAALLGLAWSGPDLLYLHRGTVPGPWPLAALAVWQTFLGVRRSEPGRCLLGLGVLSMAVLVGPGDWTIRAGFGSHLALAGALVLGLIYPGELGRGLRGFGAVGAAAAGLVVVALGEFSPGALPDWVVRQYPPALALGMACYGVLSRDRRAYFAAGVVLAAWVGSMAWASYEALRDRVVGLDAIVIGLVLLAVAQLISLAKAGLLPERFSPRKRQATDFPGD